MTALASSRREAAEWARSAVPVDPTVDVLIPTKDRTAALAVTLAGLAAQDDPPFRVILSDQSPTPIEADHVVCSLLRLLRAQGRGVEVHRHLPVRGMAEQRAFLLSQASCDHVLFLDDDVWLEPGTLELLDNALGRLGCGVVGAAVQGLSYLDDRRPAETADFEVWQHAVHPERIRRGTPEFERFRLHNAANLAHIAADLGLGRDEWVAYKIAWVGGCVMFRRDALVETGGFEFWRQLPPQHVGEDVAAQWRVMERYGGAGILPSGAVHLEAPTTLTEREVEASTVVFRERKSSSNFSREAQQFSREGPAEKGEPMNPNPNPIQVQKFLGGVDYPASKDDIVRSAQDSGADDEVLDALHGIPDREYDGPTAVSEAVAR